MIKELTKNNADNLFLLYNTCIEDFWTQKQIENSFEEREYAHFGVFEKENFVCAISVLDLPDCIEVLALATQNNHRNKGFAKQVVKFVLERYNKDCFLEVRKSNNNAIAFYLGCNFKQISVRKKYYKTKDGCEDALIFKFSTKENAQQ